MLEEIKLTEFFEKSNKKYIQEMIFDQVIHIKSHLKKKKNPMRLFNVFILL